MDCCVTLNKNKISQICKEWFKKMTQELPVNLRDQFEDEAFIVGGCIRSLILGEKVKDIDICFRKESDLIENLKTLNLGYTSSNAITLYVEKMQYQLIWVDKGHPQDIIDIFDFTMNMNYYSPKSCTLEITDVNSILNKQLVINPRCRNTVGTLARVTKFVNRGYKVPSIVDFLQVATAISKTPIKTYDQLEFMSKLYISKTDFEKIDFVDKSSVEHRKKHSDLINASAWHHTLSGANTIPVVDDERVVKKEKVTRGDSQ